MRRADHQKHVHSAFDIALGGVGHPGVAFGQHLFGVFIIVYAVGLRNLGAVVRLVKQAGRVSAGPALIELFQPLCLVFERVFGEIILEHQLLQPVGKAAEHIVLELYRFDLEHLHAGLFGASDEEFVQPAVVVQPGLCDYMRIQNRRPERRLVIVVLRSVQIKAAQQLHSVGVVLFAQVVADGGAVEIRDGAQRVHLAVLILLKGYGVALHGKRVGAVKRLHDVLRKRICICARRVDGAEKIDPAAVFFRGYLPEKRVDGAIRGGAFA